MNNPLRPGEPTGGLEIPTVLEVDVAGFDRKLVRTPRPTARFESDVEKRILAIAGKELELLGYTA